MLPVRCLGAAVLIGFATSGLAGAQSAAARTGQMVHVLVQARHLDGDPLRGLRAGDFVLSFEGKSLAASLQQAPPGQRAAAVLPPCRLILDLEQPGWAQGNTATLVTMLQGALPATFAPATVAAVLPGDRATTFVATRADLLSQLAAGPRSMRNAAASWDELAHHTGRRAIVTLTPQPNSVSPRLLHYAQAIGALVYQIGGDPAQNYIYGTSSGGGESPPATGSPVSNDPSSAPYVGINASAAQSYRAVAIKSIRLVRAEPTWSTALRDLRRDSEGFYALAVYVPSGTGPVHLRLRVSDPYRLTAEAYTADHQAPPRLEIETHRGH